MCPTPAACRLLHGPRDRMWPGLEARHKGLPTLWEGSENGIPFPTESIKWHAQSQHRVCVCVCVRAHTCAHAHTARKEKGRGTGAGPALGLAGVQPADAHSRSGCLGLDTRTHSCPSGFLLGLPHAAPPLLSAAEPGPKGDTVGQAGETAPLAGS